MPEQIRIIKKDLEQKVQDGWKKDALAKHYKLPVTQMTKLLKEAGLTIRKFHKPKYVLVDEEEENEVEVTDINVEMEVHEVPGEPENIEQDELEVGEASPTSELTTVLETNSETTDQPAQGELDW